VPADGSGSLNISCVPPKFSVFVPTSCVAASARSPSMLHEYVRPAPDEVRRPAAETKEEVLNVAPDLCSVHRCFGARRRLRTAKPLSISARLFLGIMMGRWARTRLCYETQKALAEEFGVTVRTIRRWEREIAAAGIWRIEPRGRGRQLVLLEGGHPCPPSPMAKADIHGTKADTGGHEGGHGCPPTLKSIKNSSRAAAIEVKPDPLPAPVVEALADLEALGVGSSSLARIRPRLEATWVELRRRGGDAETEFRASWRVVMERAAAPTVKNTPAWLIKVLLDGDGPLGGFVRPGRVKPPKPVGAANQRFVKPNPEVVHGT